MAVSEGTTSGRHPRVFEGNHLIANTRPTGNTTWQGSLYRDSDAGFLFTAAAVDALTDMTASGTTA